jgi:hypothetical protein
MPLRMKQLHEERAAIILLTSLELGMQFAKREEKLLRRHKGVARVLHPLEQCLELVHTGML